MGRSLGFVALLIVVAAGGYFYVKQLQITPDGSTPETMIDTTGVRNDLIAIANAERRYQVSHAKYASIDELRDDGDIHIPSRPHYTYSAKASETSFEVIATYSGSDPKAPRQIRINDVMEMTTE